MFDTHGCLMEWIFERPGEMRALPNRSQAATLEQLRDVEEPLPFELAGLDADNGGELVNHHWVADANERQRPLVFRRSYGSAIAGWTIPAIGCVPNYVMVSGQNQPVKLSARR
jgi:hypothetical protein